VIEPIEMPSAPAPAQPEALAAAPRLTGRLLRGGIWAIAGKFWNSLLIDLANALLARILSLADFAGFLLAFSCVTVLGNLGTLGLNVGVVRYVAESLSLEDVGSARRLVLRSWLIAALGSVLVALGFAVVLATVGGHWAFFTSLRPVTGQVALWIVLHALAVMQGETFRGFHKIGPASVFGTPYNLPFLFGLTLLTWQSPAALSTVLWLVLGCQGVNLLGGCLYLAAPRM
jgi:O-antigen/teichoic acid export membrane protein